MENPIQAQLTKPRGERIAWGKTLRQNAPRQSHGLWQPANGRPDPLDILQGQDEGRLTHLLPIKYGRMVASPFAFLRGSAAVMASDLAASPTSGIPAILCGDAHLSNFGLYGSPERDLIFDINDFDETYLGPWEWDIKRLAASAVVAGRENGFSDQFNREVVTVLAQTYSRAMQWFTQLPTMDVWYFHVDAQTLQMVFAKDSSKQGRKIAKKIIEKARSKTQKQTIEKLTHLEDGRRRFVSEPPLLIPITSANLDRVLEANDALNFTAQSIREVWDQYLSSLPVERQLLLQRYQLEDIALRVGGVGSVGMRCFILLFAGGAEDDAIILQLKEAGNSALAPYLPQAYIQEQAKRVVAGQHLMQAASDIFLGWHQSTLTGTQYYWRQLKDMKGSFDVAVLDAPSFKTYLSLCALCLARAHARTSDEAAIHGYLGRGRAFGKALADFAVTYADQTERDHQRLVEAIKAGRINAEIGI